MQAAIGATSGPAGPPEEAARSGVYSAGMLRGAISDGVVRAAHAIRDDQIQPASLDLRIGARGFRLRSSFLPGGARIRDRLPELQVGPEIDLARPGGVVLDRRVPYLIQLDERLRLPGGVGARANPRSSTGRLDIFTRLLTDRGSQFDEVQDGYEGPLWLELYSNTFTISLRAGLCLAQLRLTTAGEPLAPGEIAAEHRREPLLFAPGAGSRDPRQPIAEPRIGSRGLLLSVSLPSGGYQVGWRARNHAPLLDLSVTGAYDPLHYWEPVEAERGGRLVLDPDYFYLLVSREYVRIPPSLAAEMAAYDPTNGELRTHYAGFFDPGFGYGPDLRGTRAVLEVRAHDIPFLLEDGQPIARLAYERMAEEPEQLYGAAGSGSHFQHQGISLSRQFRPVSGAITFRLLGTD